MIVIPITSLLLNRCSELAPQISNYKIYILFDIYRTRGKTSCQLLVGKLSFFFSFVSCCLLQQAELLRPFMISSAIPARRRCLLAFWLGLNAYFKNKDKHSSCHRPSISKLRSVLLIINVTDWLRVVNNYTSACTTNQQVSLIKPFITIHILYIIEDGEVFMIFKLTRKHFFNCLNGILSQCLQTWEFLWWPFKVKISSI